jgi:ectoine hydroxylase-related dioxygenase (phytanoyl-CoA dioxygenase family)
VKDQFEADGYYVLRSVLSEGEVDRLARPIQAAFTNGDYDTYREESAYPMPGIHSMGPRVLEQHPEIAELSMAHPAIIKAVEDLFGEEATLAQYWSIMRPPGAGVPDEPYVKGSGAHYDYKPWRCVGSYVKWMFAVIPFVDYTETVGPLAVAPGSHLKSMLLPSNGRVHGVDAACVPVPSDITMVDPQLKKGDVVLMHGFTWHEARPNYGNSDRCGLYMKFHAKSSPPACGPTIFPTAVHDHLQDDVKHLVPHHRGDGKYAALRDGPVGGVDEAQLLIEDAEDRILVLGDDTLGWHLPSVLASEDATAGILDVCNVMGSVVTQAREQLGLQLPWLSWLQDVVDSPADGGKEQLRCRVYGHRLGSVTPHITAGHGDSVPHHWMSEDELDEAHTTGKLESGGRVHKWLHMWRAEEDEHGQPVTRSFGVPTTDVQYYSFNRNGNRAGTYRVGEFDDEGRPTPAADAPL